MKMEQSVPKRRHIKFRRRGIIQKKAYNIQNTAKVWNQEINVDFEGKNHWTAIPLYSQQEGLSEEGLKRKHAAKRDVIRTWDLGKGLVFADKVSAA